MATEAPDLSTPRFTKAEKLIVDGQHQPDNWLLCPKETTPEDLAGYEAENLILPLACWLAAGEQIAARRGQTGVWLQSHERAETLVAESHTPVTDIPLIAVDFPVFSDGRGYTTARTLRSALGYKGEMRAIGDVLRDQLFYMRRCGFSAYAMREDQDLESSLSAFSDFQEAYQAAVDQPLPLFRRGRTEPN